MASRVDANQREIVAALRDAGRTVQCLHDVGRGVPDLLVSYRGRNFLLEVKAPGGTLTPTQRLWHGAWDAPVSVVTTAQQAIDATVSNA